MTIAVSLRSTLKAREDFPFGKSCYTFGKVSCRMIGCTDHNNLSFGVGKFHACDLKMPFLDFQHVLDFRRRPTDTFRIISGTDETT